MHLLVLHETKWFDPCVEFDVLTSCSYSKFGYDTAFKFDL